MLYDGTWRARTQGSTDQSTKVVVPVKQGSYSYGYASPTDTLVPTDTRTGMNCYKTGNIKPLELFQGPFLCLKKWWAVLDSNQWPTACKAYCTVSKHLSSASKLFHMPWLSIGVQAELEKIIEKNQARPRHDMFPDNQISGE